MPKRETKKIKPSQEVIKEGPFLVAIHLKVRPRVFHSVQPIHSHLHNIYTFYIC